MPEVDVFEAPQGGTFHERLLEAITEAFAGNGITNNGDSLATADPDTAMGVDVSGASGLRYDGESYGPTAASFTLSEGPTTETNGEADRRADLLYFDPTDGDDGAFNVLEGDPHPNPEPPDTPDDGLMVAVIDVEHDAQDVVDDDIINWRAFPAVTYQADTGELSDAAVTTSKLDDAAVTTAKIATDAVTNDEVADDAIGTAQLQDGSVVRAKIGDNAVGTGELGDGAVTTAKLDDGSVVAAKIDTDAVGSDELADGSVSDTHVADDADISRSKLDRDRITEPISGDHATTNEDVILVDTSTGSHTVTLSSDDVVDGRSVQVIDVAGVAESNPITVDTEGDETIDGDPSFDVDTDWGGIAVISDGDDWFTAGGGTGGGDVETRDDGDTVVEAADSLDFRRRITVDDAGDGVAGIDVDVANAFEGREGGQVEHEQQGIVAVDNIPDGGTVDVYKAGLTLATLEAAPADVDLELVTFDNSGGYTTQDVIVTGDGSTVHDRVEGDPLASYTNETGDDISVGVIVDNQSGGGEDVFAYAEGVTVA